MNSRTGKRNQTRRAFFSDVTASAALSALAIAQLGSPTAAMAQEKKETLNNLRVPPNLPPWPKGTSGNKYDHLFCTRMKEIPLTDTILTPTISFRGNSDLPGAGINMGFRYYVKPFKMELQSHHHDVDEYLFFLGGQLPDLTANFDAEIEIFLGPEYERHIITKPSILYIPRGFEHNPMDIKRVGKPLLFMPLLLSPYFNGYYQTGYMQFLSHEKVD
jgi:mannose-6-phosphate isomerase-like protein (cupin superfamily)